MARTRDFDIDQATDRAVRVFWTRGYAATTVRQLCTAMKINIGSFYAAFGSKQACFRRALARYAATQAVPREPSPAAIRAWFDVVVDPARTPRGCLLVGSAVEAPLLDRRSRAAVQATLAAVEDFFRRSLAAGGHDPDGAPLLASTVTSIHVMARAGVPAPALRALADRALAAAGLA
ncbi:MAG: TetR/AcrR family transcriptional regulator [Kofleriaceae bacterium]|nr:TetR/AcrR family transcriptional regulator [Kofleriaceae bacterium]MCB9571108.1 TetR/AcrR family transcriptional regulator [Kofleriaceae bacterium]